MQVLEGVVDRQYFIGDEIWNNHGFRGFDAGSNLKSTNGWSYNGNGTDQYDFCGLPAGSRVPGFSSMDSRMTDFGGHHRLISPYWVITVFWIISAMGFIVVLIILIRDTVSDVLKTISF